MVVDRRLRAGRHDQAEQAQRAVGGTVEEPLADAAAHAALGRVCWYSAGSQSRRASSCDEERLDRGASPSRGSPRARSAAGRRDEARGRRACRGRTRRARAARGRGRGSRTWVVFLIHRENYASIGCRVAVTDHAPPSHVAIVTGANHGIGAADGARPWPQRGVRRAVHVPARSTTPPDPGMPEAYRDHRAAGRGGRRRPRSRPPAAGAVAVEADLTDPAAPARLFDDGRAAARAGRHPGQQRDRLAGRHVHAGQRPTGSARRCEPVTAASLAAAVRASTRWPRRC